MKTPLLLCCDLDRTVLPNGLEPEDPRALQTFREVTDHPDITLAYVTGRSRTLTEKAIERWDLPQPEIVATDVGSTIYSIGTPGQWESWNSWHHKIAEDWNGYTVQDMARALSHIAALTPQPDDRQTPFKLCYFAPPDADGTALVDKIRGSLSTLDVRAEVIWSIDETVPIGLIDVVPASATKQGAVYHIMEQLGFTVDNTLFAGDSGNDLPVLTGPIKSVLVANATEAVRMAAIEGAQNHGTADALYLAKGGMSGLDGCYSAGILEGLHHYFPDYCSWLTPTLTP